MASTYLDDQEFNLIDYRKEDIQGIQFEECIFNQCNFTGVSLSKCTFISCTFIDCDLSSAKIPQTAFQEVEFKNCKLMGLDFSGINSFLFNITATNSQISLCSFARLKMPQSTFDNCDFTESDFWKTNLSKSIFANCNLDRCSFEQSNLSNADLSTAYNFNINPDLNTIKGATFSKENLIGLLHKYQIKLN